jgi:hypothetical protein
MAAKQKSVSPKVHPEQLDLYPSQAKYVGIFACLVCARYGSNDRAADAIGASPHGLSYVRLGARHCRQPASVIDALARYAGCTRVELLAGKATLPTVQEIAS